MVIPAAEPMERSVMRIIDFHSHILPGIDDGSSSMEMSEEMLKECAAQSVEVVAATPHFYGESMALNDFLKKRDEAYKRLAERAKNREICLIPGAETAFFPGIGSAAGIERLTLADTPLLLLEMPFRPWNGEDLREVERLAERGIRPIIAHIERFYHFQKDEKILMELFALPVLIQVNAEALLNWRTRRPGLKLFSEGKAHLLGSDCHNLRSRPPNLEAGRKVIEKKLGEEFVKRMDRLGEKLLGEKMSNL